MREEAKQILECRRGQAPIPCRVVALALSFLLALSCIGTAPMAMAFASSGASDMGSNEEAQSQGQGDGLELVEVEGPANFEWDLIEERPADQLPQKFFLTNAGMVTSAKNQSPWGTCWAFAAASAIESSILRAQKLGAPSDGSAADPGEYFASIDMATPRITGLETSVDISERAIAWFSQQLQTEASATSQAGEGYYRMSPDDMQTQLAAGNFAMFASMLAARQGLVSESLAPYAYNGYDPSVPWYSLGSISGGADDARMRDWSLPDQTRLAEDCGYRVVDIVNLESPATSVVDYTTSTSNYQSYNPNGTLAIKNALMDIGAVAIALESDTRLPRELRDLSGAGAAPSEHFTYSTWSQYNASSNLTIGHSVAIVGWDDTYPASNFQGTASGAPPADGAWLCKNNWGSDDFFNATDTKAASYNWGLQEPSSTEPDSINSTGFFWLSFFDHSISTPVAYVVEPIEQEDANLYQYDYLSTSEFEYPATYSGEAKVANVFTADNIELIDEVCTWTFGPDESVDTWIYILPNTSDTLESGVRSTAITGEQFKAELDKAILACSQTTDFPMAGFHTIELNTPVLVNKAQRFAIIQQVNTKTADSNGQQIDATYLPLELAYTDTEVLTDIACLPQVVANPGETFVLALEKDRWSSVDEYNDWYADLKAQGNVPVDKVYGNAVIKATTKDTSMGKGDFIYDTVRLRS